MTFRGEFVPSEMKRKYSGEIDALDFIKKQIIVTFMVWLNSVKNTYAYYYRSETSGLLILS